MSGKHLAHLQTLIYTWKYMAQRTPKCLGFILKNQATIFCSALRNAGGSVWNQSHGDNSCCTSRGNLFSRGSKVQMGSNLFSLVSLAFSLSLYIYNYVFWPHLWHAELPWPEPTPQLSPESHSTDNTGLTHWATREHSRQILKTVPMVHFLGWRGLHKQDSWFSIGFSSKCSRLWVERSCHP